MVLNLDELINGLPESWLPLLLDNTTHLEDISKQLNDISLKLNPLEIYPKSEDIFNAFRFKPLDEIRVVIIGQDCYHGPNQATGLCFAVNNEITLNEIQSLLKNSLQPKVC